MENDKGRKNRSERFPGGVNKRHNPRRLRGTRVERKGGSSAGGRHKREREREEKTGGTRNRFCRSVLVFPNFRARAWVADSFYRCGRCFRRRYAGMADIVSSVR